MSGASTTTTAGLPPPGNTCWIRLYVCRAAVFCGRSLAPGVAVCRRSTGSASTISAHSRERRGQGRAGQYPVEYRSPDPALAGRLRRPANGEAPVHPVAEQGEQGRQQGQ